MLSKVSNAWLEHLAVATSNNPYDEWLVSGVVVCHQYILLDHLDKIKFLHSNNMYFH